VFELAEDGSGYTAHGDTKTAERRRVQGTLLRILHRESPGFTYEEIKESREWGDGGARKQEVLAALRSGYETGTYGRTGEGRKRDPYRYFKLVTNDLLAADVPELLDSVPAVPFGSRNRNTECSEFGSRSS